MAFSDPTKFDHDGDGQPGGSLPKGDPMAKSTVDAAAGSDTITDVAVAETPRDELRDSYDPHTGSLTAEAQEIRRNEAAVPDWAGGASAGEQEAALSGDTAE